MEISVDVIDNAGSSDDGGLDLEAEVAYRPRGTRITLESCLCLVQHHIDVGCISVIDADVCVIT